MVIIYSKKRKQKHRHWGLENKRKKKKKKNYEQVKKRSVFLFKMLFHCAAFLSAISRSPLSSRMSWRHHRFGLVRLISLPIYGHKTAEASLGVISEDLGALGCKLDAACQGYMGTGREMRKEFRENICRFCDLCYVWEAKKDGLNMIPRKKTGS